jgi:hypothetical protein
MLMMLISWAERKCNKEEKSLLAAFRKVGPEVNTVKYMFMLFYQDTGQNHINYKDR